MKAYIIMFNRLSYPKKMAEFLSDTGCEVVLVDNCSTYPPLLEWYKSCPYSLIKMDRNYGHQAVWLSGLIDNLNDRYYIVTDHDLDLSGVPVDYIDVLKRGLINSPDVIKSGLSLEINDLPDNPFVREVINWETKFWETPKRGSFFLSDIDTTFAMYDGEREFGQLPNNRFFSAIRADRPYTAKHLPWYNTPEFLAGNEEERYYQEHTTTYWSAKYKELI